MDHNKRIFDNKLAASVPRLTLADPVNPPHPYDRELAAGLPKPVCTGGGVTINCHC